MAANIFWLASYPKSGNTWLRAFLLHLFKNAHEQQPLDDLTDISIFDSTATFFNKLVDKERVKWKDEETAAWRVPVQRDLSSRFETTSFIKTHSAFMPWQGHPMFEPSLIAGAVYVIRNPLDVAGSLAAGAGMFVPDAIKMMNTENFVWPASTAQVPQLIGSWSQNVATWTSRPDPTLHVMRYEDMVERPMEAFGNLTKFFKVALPPGCLERAVEFASFDRLRADEEAHGFKERGAVQERFFRSGRAGAWRQELKPDQAQRIVDTHRTQMARFGYVPDDM